MAKELTLVQKKILEFLVETKSKGFVPTLA